MCIYYCWQCYHWKTHCLELHACLRPVYLKCLAQTLIISLSTYYMGTLSCTVCFFNVMWCMQQPLMNSNYIHVLCTVTPKISELNGIGYLWTLVWFARLFGKLQIIRKRVIIVHIYVRCVCVSIFNE